MKDLPNHPDFGKEQVRTALLLAAGTGSRLAPLTDKTPKCLIPVNETSILERLLDALHFHNFTRLVIVVGHQAVPSVIFLELGPGVLISPISPARYTKQPTIFIRYGWQGRK